MHLSQPMSCAPLDDEEDLLRGEAAPGPPAAVTPPAGDATPPGGADTCCVWLEELALGARGGRRAVPLPVCTRHSMHLACLAQWRVQASEPRSLLCPLCRDVPCRFCSVERWGPAQDALLRELCASEGVPVPGRLPPMSTVQAAVQDYTLRTFTSNDAPEPPCPQFLAVLCCPRVGAVRNVGGTVEFVELDDRTMPWSPVPQRGGDGICGWTRAWTCSRCSRHVEWGDIAAPDAVGRPCPRCARPL